jgi:hypothetical protein
VDDVADGGQFGAAGSLGGRGGRFRGRALGFQGGCLGEQVGRVLARFFALADLLGQGIELHLQGLPLFQGCGGARD